MESVQWRQITNQFLIYISFFFLHVCWFFGSVDRLPRLQCCCCRFLLFHVFFVFSSLFSIRIFLPHFFSHYLRCKPNYTWTVFSASACVNTSIKLSGSNHHVSHFLHYSWLIDKLCHKLTQIFVHYMHCTHTQNRLESNAFGPCGWTQWPTRKDDASGERILYFQFASLFFFV